MAKKKPKEPVETSEQRSERWKRRAARSRRQRDQDVANMRAARTQKYKDKARQRRKEAAPTPAMLARRGAKETAAARKIFERWLLAVPTQTYAMKAGRLGNGLSSRLRGALHELSTWMADTKTET